MYITLSKSHYWGDLFFVPWKCLILRMKIRSISSKGPIVFYLYIIWVRKRIWDFQVHDTKKTFFFVENVLFADGWTGRTVYQKGPLLFFIWRYIKYYTYIYLNTSTKCPDKHKLFVGFKFWSCWESGSKNSKHLQGGILIKSQQL